MSDKLDRFTKRARRALTLMQEEALRLNHDVIDIEHLLLGLARDDNGPVAQVLRELDVEPAQVIRAVSDRVARGQTPPGTKPTLTQHTKRVIELSVDEAHLMGHYYIGVEHLLLGLIRDDEGIAVDVLRELGINLNRLCTQMASYLLQEQAHLQPNLSLHRPTTKPLYDDLTAAAPRGFAAGKFDPLIGRQQELERLIQILARRTKHNALLIGEPGVGKHALVKGLAQRMSDGYVPAVLLNRSLRILNTSSVVTSVVYREQVVERLQQMLDQHIADGAILFVDKMHAWIGAAGTNVEAATLLKSAVGRGDLQVIGVTTPSQYNKFIGKEGEREWSMQTIRINEPSPEEALEILRGVKGGYDQHHQVVFTDEALQAAVQLAVRHAPDRFLPEKAIDLMDEAGSRVRMVMADEQRTAFLALQQVKKQKEEALEAQQLDESLTLRQREVELEAKLDELRTHQPPVTPEDIAEVVSLWTKTVDR